MRIVLGGMMTPSFASSSRSKRSFAVNVKHADGLRILRCMLAVRRGAGRPARYEAR